MDPKDKIQAFVERAVRLPGPHEDQYREIRKDLLLRGYSIQRVESMVRRTMVHKRVAVVR